MMIRALSKTTCSLRRQTTCFFPSKASSSSMAVQKDENKVIRSASQKFKDIPVHGSILEYIRSIGVGVPPRVTRRRRRQASSVLHQSERRSRRSSTAGRRIASTPDEGNTMNHPPPQQQQQQQQRDHIWMPPPPFGPKCLPVQVVGSVGPESVEESGVNMKKNSFPRNASLIPEIALAGRSNVGKSTLLNALLYGNRDENGVKREHKQRGRVPVNVKLPKGVKAVMSSKPGETRRITFYQLQQLSMIRLEDEVETRRLMLVDLPGYGFAYARESHTAAFRTLMSDYLLNRGKALKRVLILIDARHGMKKADLDFLDMLQQQQGLASSSSDNKRGTEMPPIQLVLTKCDLVAQTDLARRVAQVRQQLSDTLRREPSQLPVMLVSARAGVGFNNVDRRENRARGGVLELQKELAALATPRRRKATKSKSSKQ